MGENEATAVAVVREGDEDAFRRLVESHSQDIFRLAYRMMGNAQDAEDVVQETFLRAYERFHQFEYRAQVGTWLYRIAANYSMDRIRERQRRGKHYEPHESVPVNEVVSLAAATPQPDRLLFSDQVREQVNVILGTMSPIERAAFVLRHYEGMSIEEIGSALGLKVSATKHAIFRAVQKMRHALEPLVRPAR